MHDVNHNVVTGYFSILLVNLCLNIDASAQVQQSLGVKGLDTILSTAEEFLQYHQKVDQESPSIEAKVDYDSGLTTRLKSFISHIKEREC